jgi:hypothetical protein
MKNYKITGFKHGVWSTQIIKTVPECITLRAKENGFTEITNIEEV